MYNFYYDYDEGMGQYVGPRANGTSDNYLIGSGSGGLFEGGGGTGDVSGGVTNVTASGVTVITTGRRKSRKGFCRNTSFTSGKWRTF